MRKPRHWTTAILAAALLLVPGLVIVRAQTAGQDMQDAGHKTKQAAKDTGRATKKTTKKAAHSTKKDSKIGLECDEAWHKEGSAQDGQYD